MKIFIRLVLVIVTLSVCQSAFSANTISKITYKWTDKQGIVQYTEHPPKNMPYEKITVKASGGQEVMQVTEAESTKISQDAVQGNDTLDDVVRANERNCVVSKQNLKVLTNLSRIRVTDEKGENRILSPEEKQEQITETQKQIDIYCTKTD